MKNEKKTMADVRRKVSRKQQPISRNDQVLQPTTTQPKHNLSSPKILNHRKPLKNMDIAKSSAISHFISKKQASPTASVSIGAQKPIVKPIARGGHIPHPMMQRIQPKPKANENSSKSVKEIAIAEAFQKIAIQQEKELASAKKRRKLVQIILVVITLVGVGAYLLFVNLPAIAVSYASNKSGFEASIPSFCPMSYVRDGYAYLDNGSVIIKYKSSISNSSFTISQSKSSWDSSAVKDLVNEQSAGEFIATEKNGLTIFTFNNSTSATWVNGGILYTITGDAPLKTDEIQQIALSL